MYCSLPGSSVHGIFQTRVLEWGAIAFSGFSHEMCLIPTDVCITQREGRDRTAAETVIVSLIPALRPELEGLHGTSSL